MTRFVNTARSFATLAFLAAALAAPAPGRAAVKTKELTYDAGGTKLKGFLAWDDATKGKRPGVLVIHEWWGHNEHARAQARRLAEAGYVGFALDMFGNGKVAKHPDDAKAFVAEVTKDTKVLAGRFNAALALMKKQAQVDPERTAAFGYCFGGGVALNMARAGADLDAIAAFHAGLQPAADPAAKGRFKPQAVLAAVGGADPMIPQEQVQAFEQEMKAAGVDARVLTFPDAKHGFTNPEADKAGLPALAYHAQADEESFDAAIQMLRKVFGGG